MKSYWIDFESVSVEAESFDEAHEKARGLIREQCVEIEQIEEEE